LVAAAADAAEGEIAGAFAFSVALLFSASSIWLCAFQLALASLAACFVVRFRSIWLVVSCMEFEVWEEEEGAVVV
jgi:hypothetical protein